jgi:hypothetical protein
MAPATDTYHKTIGTKMLNTVRIRPRAEGRAESWFRIMVLGNRVSTFDLPQECSSAGACVSLNPTVSQFFSYITGTRDRFYIATSGGNGDVGLLLEQSCLVCTPHTRNEEVFVCMMSKGVSLW